MIEAQQPAHGIRVKPGRYVALDSLRGVCACMVVLYHCKGDSHLSSFAPIHNGWLFVDFFFVLSGFVIATSYGDRLASGFRIRDFMWRRFWRVYPLHLVVLLAFLAFEVATMTVLPAGMMGREPFQGVNSVEGLVASLFLVQIFIGPSATWNMPAWSIAAEIWTYLIFAVLMRFSGRLLVPICLGIASAGVIVLAQLTDRYMNVFHEGALLRCMFGFAMGVVAWRLVPTILALNVGGKITNTCIEIAAALLVGGYLTVFGSGPGTLAAPLVFFVAVLVFARERGALSAALMTPAPVRLGLLSYSIYMVHLFILYRFVNGLSLVERVTGLDVVSTAEGGNTIGGGAWAGDFLSLALLAIVIAVAHFSHRLVEIPGQNFGKRGVRR